MDVTRILEADHRSVEELFTKISKAEGQDRMHLHRGARHVAAGAHGLEETTLYCAMQPVTGAEAVGEGETETTSPGTC